MENIKENSNVKRIINIVLNSLFYLFIVLLFLFAISNIKGKSNNIPNLFGYGYLTVKSESMKTEFSDTEDDPDDFEIGDMILIKIANKKNIEKLKIGDIITFYDITIDDTLTELYGSTYTKDLTKLNTHRIVDISVNAKGEKVYTTQGDYVKVKAPQNVYVSGSESNTNQMIQTFKSEDIKGIYVKKLGSGINNTLTFLRSSLGFGLCIVLPTALLLIFEAVVLIRNLLKMNREKLEAQLNKDKEAQAIDLEEQKRKMKEELLAELRKEQEEASKKEDKTEEGK